MRKLYALMGCSFLLISACVSQSDFEKLKYENECLKKRIMELEADKNYLNEKYNALVVEKRITELQSRENRFFTELQAIEYLEDYYNYFRKNYVYRNPVVRRSSDNSFIISLEESDKTIAEQNKELWIAVVWSLKINANGTYTFE